MLTRLDLTKQCALGPMAILTLAPVCGLLLGRRRALVAANRQTLAFRLQTARTAPFRQILAVVLGRLHWKGKEPTHAKGVA